MNSESQEQRETHVLQQLAQARAHIIEDIAATPDLSMKRIEAEAAIVVTLSIVNELLPEAVQEQVRAILSLHDQIWQLDTPPPGGTTPRKPLGRGWLGRLPFFSRPPDSHLSIILQQ